MSLSEKGRFAALMRTASVAALLAMACAPVPAIAQTANVPAAARSFAIPPGPLAPALNRFADISQLQLVYSGVTTRGLSSAGLSGSFTAQEGLARLLAGTGLSYRFSGPNSVTITRAPAAAAAGATAGAIPLDTIDVQDQGVIGYVARNGSAGSKTSTPLIETPRSISVVTRQELDDRGVTSVPEALRYTAGVTTGAFGYDPRFDQIYVRGFPMTTLGDFRDGLKQFPAGFTTFRTEPYQLDRIEVIKGPAAVLYGQSVPGGLVDRRSKLPTDYSFGEVSAQLGTYGRVQGAFDVGGPLDPDKTMLYRVVGLGRLGDTNLDIADQRVLIAPSFTWRPNAATSLTVQALYQQDETDSNVAGINRNGAVLKLRSSDARYDYLKQKQAQIGYAFEHKFDDVFTFRQKVRYSAIDAESRYLSGSFASPASTIYQRGAVSVGDRLASFQTDNNVEANFRTGPIAHKLLVGLNYDHNIWRFGLGQSGVVPAYALDIANPISGIRGPTPPYAYRSREQLAQLGLYAQDQISFGNWRLALSARQDWTERKQSNLITRAVTVDRKDDAFTYSAGLLYLFDNGLAPYVSYATSFQPVTSQGLGGTVLEPSKGEQIEAGLKYQPGDGRILLTASAYQLKEKNAPKLGGYVAGLPYYVSVGEVTVRGIELEARARLVDGLDLTAAYTFSDAEITKTTVASELGRVPAVTPRHVASLWMNYNIQSGVFAGLGAGVGARYVGETWTTNDNTGKNDAYTLFDAVLRYDFGKMNPKLAGLTASVAANNIADKQVSVCNAGFCYLSQGRTVIGTMTYRW
ncbi:TonB-dependent siderophore receptor [Bosea sp. NPDC003192]|uniref:TonB-dependent siderophore receptor n=1 Tax=Bosea sp. NPDC003192 TaxID=3390551 RepID=UPI003D059C72